MALTLKEAVKRPELLSGGHRACAGCAAPVILRQVMRAAGRDTVVSFATGCMEVSTTIFPDTAWNVSYIHNAFENSAATMSGVESAYRALKRKGKIDRKMNFIAFGGDGGTYDIGFQSLSGAMERGHNMLYICYDNEAYMNTGIQRSSSTPKGAHTNTSQAGKVRQGKGEHKKDLTHVMIAHGIPYVAQASPHNPVDLMRKVEKACAIEGPAFMNIFASCNRGWRIPMEQSIEVGKDAADCCVWPLFEVENGSWTLNYKPREKKPIKDYLLAQGRFKHLKKEENQYIIDELQEQVDKRWDWILSNCEGK